MHGIPHSNTCLRISSGTRDEHKNHESGSKFYEHCWCDGCGYGPREFSNSNCTGSVGICGVWKANKFWCGYTKYLIMEFRILTEYSFQFPYLCNAWYLLIYVQWYMSPFRKFITEWVHIHYFIYPCRWNESSIREIPKIIKGGGGVSEYRNRLWRAPAPSGDL